MFPLPVTQCCNGKQHSKYPCLPGLSNHDGFTSNYLCNHLAAFWPGRNCFPPTWTPPPSSSTHRPPPVHPPFPPHPPSPHLAVLLASLIPRMEWNGTQQCVLFHHFCGVSKQKALYVGQLVVTAVEAEAVRHTPFFIKGVCLSWDHTGSYTYSNNHFITNPFLHTYLLSPNLQQSTRMSISRETMGVHSAS